MAKYNVQIRYIQGKSNVIADALSRISHMEPPAEDNEVPLVELDTISRTLPASPAKLDEVREYTDQDVVLRHLGIALHASPTDSTRDIWVRFVRTKRKNFFPQPRARFVICSAHFEEHCFTRAFDPTQRRQIKPGSLPSIWKGEEPSTDTDSPRQRHMKEKERQKVSLIF